MKRLSLLIVMEILLCTLQACNGHNKGKNYNADPDSISAKDSMAAVKDSSKKIAFTEDNEDIRFVAEAASGGLKEVVLGKIAMQKAVNKRVKNFGVMMVKDHSKINDKLMALAESKHLTLPTVPNIKDQQVIDELSKKSGAEFDSAYVKDMMADHNNDIKEFQNASQNSLDPDIKSFAIKTLRVLQNHLDAINTINGSMK